VSSANIIGMAVGSTALGRSLIYIKKSKGPKMDPCGTPCVIVLLCAICSTYMQAKKLEEMKILSYIS
jgi:hypothetical protein